MFRQKRLSVGPVGKMMMENVYFFLVDVRKPFGVFNRFTIIDIPGHKKNKKGNEKDQYDQCKYPVHWP